MGEAVSDRRGFIGGLFALVGLSAEQEHKHDWKRGPFYLTAAKTYEEPGYYPPSTLLNVEHCIGCGLIRLPKPYWNATGSCLDCVQPAEVKP